MFVLKEKLHSKKRLRDSLESVRDHSCDDTEHPHLAKRTRSAQSNAHTCHRPPGFWDSLSKVHLTRGALRESDRRGAQNRQQSSLVPSDNGALTESRVRQLQRFSRHGGPDLTHVRGFAFHDQDHAMSQSTSSRKRSSTSGRSDSTHKSRSSYDSNFKQNLIDGGIYPEGYEPDDTNEARNLAAINEALPIPRASLSPSQFSDGAFKEFRRTNARATGETQIMADVLSVIEGKGRHKYHSGGPDHLFNHLTPLTEFLPTAKPDTYDGGLPAHIDRRVRHDLGRHIVPCNDSSRPVAPNFFIEGKSASGRADVAKLQACHDGAIGIRVMDSLQNYGASEPEYDCNMKSFSSTYHPGTGTLKLYGHHLARPQAPGNRPQYHMTQIGGYDMTNNRETFQEGATAFRNVRDLAQKRRDELIAQANRAARHAPTESLSTTFTDSVTSLSVLRESEPDDTSADELAIEETTIKRTRHMPRAQSKHDPVTSRHPTTSTNNVSLHSTARPRHMINDSLLPRHTTPRTGNVASHSDARSRHTIDVAVEEPKKQTRPSRKLSGSRHAPDDRVRK